MTSAFPPVGSAEPALLTADIRVRRGSFTLAAAVAAQPGEVIAVLGPNGAGKSTLLAVLAGLIHPSQGRVSIAGRIVSTPERVLPPQRRRVGLMGQDPLLFPHLTAAENIAFGPRSQGRTRSEARQIASDWLHRVGLAGMAARRPDRLSGGQRQRVALARALAAEPDLLLLDEPFGALDVETVPEIRQLVRTHLADRKTTTLLVTHNVLDAAVLADRAMVLQAGTVIDDGPVVEVLSAPRSPFTATLAGLNLVSGKVSGPGAAGQPAVVTAAGLFITGLAADDLSVASAASAVFPPSAVAVYRDDGVRVGSGSPRNSLPGTVSAVEPGAGAVRLRAVCGTPGFTVAADVTVASVAELGLRPGVPVRLAIKATEVRLYER